MSTNAQQCQTAAKDALEAVRNAAEAAVVEIQRALTVAEDRIAEMYGHVLDADEEIERIQSDSTHRKVAS